MIVPRCILLTVRNVPNVQKITAHFTSNNRRAVYEIMWKKYGTARQATDDYTAHALCVLGN